ncbi:DUF2553 family protein [Bacillus lacus]|uniref:DUF2553 family protein n=1 Tax=Metabacillus lacus TaxID=1983721 RepID=A0A7X2LY60_9BACI|nr:YusG family protein [Metabacillus lacus]MRX72021.1 DUF2553 family protein [Metabacillus lacus]
MSFEKKKLDITDRVTGRFIEGQMELFVEKEQIGQMTYGAEGSQVNLKDGYQFEENRFYHYTDVLSKGEEQYVDCDYENGWC